MSLPIHIKGKVSLSRDPDNKLTIESLREYLTDSILQKEAKTVDAKQDEIYFKVGWFRPFLGWKLLVPVTTGQISIHADDSKLLVNYKLSFEHLIIIATVITVVMCGPILLTSPSLADNAFQVISIFIIWLWLVFGNVVITAFRFPRFIKKCAAEVKKQFYIKAKK